MLSDQTHTSTCVRTHLGRFFSHKVNVCLLKITLIQWVMCPVPPCRSSLDYNVCDIKMWCSFLVLKGFWSFRIPKINHRHFSHPSDQVHFTQPPFQKNAGNTKCRFSDPAFLSPPPFKFNLGFQSKQKCFLKAGHTWIKLRFVPYPCTLSSNELIILSLDAGSAADVEILGLKVRIIQLFRSLRKKHSSRVKLQISWLWKPTRILFFKQREWKSVGVKIIPCFQQKGKYRDYIQLWTRVI